MSWHEAVAYCEWARTTLPTEEQWELAARGPEGREYPWGGLEPSPEHANYRDTGIRRAPTPVGLFPAGNTPDGISDMAGNVWEWTRSIYEKERRGVRGGSFLYFAGSLRAASRLRDGAGYRDLSIGFRCIRE